METVEFLTMSKEQDANWWYLGRKKIVESVLKRFVTEKIKIADVACGSGAHLSLLQKFGQVTALEENKYCLEEVKRNFGNSVKALAWSLPEPVNEKFDLLVLTDVLEHLPDDKLAVQWMSNHLKVKGRVLITVPAHMFFWSEMDEAVHHFRRYNKQGLMSLLSGDFEIVYCSYYNAFLFPVKVLFKVFSKLVHLVAKPKQKKSFNDMPLGPINSLFTKIMSIEAFMIPNQVLPFGVSLVLFAQKKK